jgi:hypothetical protein
VLRFAAAADSRPVTRAAGAAHAMPAAARPRGAPWAYGTLPGRLVLLVAACALLAGCGSGRPVTAPVRGTVTFHGQPVTTGRIVFYPAEGRPAMGDVGPDGTYELRTFEPGDGAILGPHVVTITATRTTGPPMPSSFEEELAGGGAAAPPGADSAVEWLVPEKYSQRSTTPLTAEVESGNNRIDFELPVDE